MSQPYRLLSTFAPVLCAAAFCLYSSRLDHFIRDQLLGALLDTAPQPWLEPLVLDQFTFDHTPDGQAGFTVAEAATLGAPRFLMLRNTPVPEKFPAVTGGYLNTLAVPWLIRTNDIAITHLVQHYGSGLYGYAEPFSETRWNQMFNIDPKKRPPDNPLPWGGVPKDRMVKIETVVTSQRPDPVRGWVDSASVEPVLFDKGGKDLTFMYRGGLYVRGGGTNERFLDTTWRRLSFVSWHDYDVELLTHGALLVIFFVALAGTGAIPPSLAFGAIGYVVLLSLFMRFSTVVVERLHPLFLLADFGLPSVAVVVAGYRAVGSVATAAQGKSLTLARAGDPQVADFISIMATGNVRGLAEDLINAQLYDLAEVRNRPLSWWRLILRLPKKTASHDEQVRMILTQLKAVLDDATALVRSHADLSKAFRDATTAAQTAHLDFTVEQQKKTAEAKEHRARGAEADKRTRDAKAAASPALSPAVVARTEELEQVTHETKLSQQRREKAEAEAAIEKFKPKAPPPPVDLKQQEQDRMRQKAAIEQAKSAGRDVILKARQADLADAIAAGHDENSDEYKRRRNRWDRILEAEIEK